MKSIKELQNLMLELLEDRTGRETFKFTKRDCEIIDEISDYAEQTQIYQECKDYGATFYDYTAKQVYGYMLDRIVNAPTTYHRDASVILIMPFLRQKLREETDDEKTQAQTFAGD